MKKSNIFTSAHKSLLKGLSLVVALFSLISFSSCESPSFSPEVGSCVDLSFVIDGVSVENTSRYDTTSYYSYVMYPKVIYTVVGDTISFGQVASQTLSRSSAEIKNVTYMVTSVAEKELCLVAKDAVPDKTFSGAFDSAGTYTLIILPTWNSDHPNMPNGFSWAINMKIVVVDYISELPKNISPIGINTFNLRLSRAIYPEP